ncbi:hypothetical protein HWV62_11578 [Athelia sp. TMB]|nr:hypothetical protein HWV62_11578 [Athelia sp. TMB]
MREFTPLGVEWVAKALKLSEDLEVDETNTKVRRTKEIQEPKGQFERSVYAKGFGAETPGIQEELEKFFNDFGRANAVRMRRIDSTKEFKGSVFVEFADFSTVEKFLKADPKPQWKGEELLTMSKEAYCEMKIKEKGLTGKSAAIRRDSLVRPSGRGFNAFQEMNKEKNKGKEGAADKPKPEIWLEFMGTKLRVLEEDGGSVQAEDVPYVKGATLKFTGCGGNASFKDLKDPLREHFGRVPFIEYQKGADDGLVGFDKSLTEEDIAFVKEHIKTVNDQQVQQAGEKRKRAVEPAGAADTGLRGQAVPMIQSIKKAKVDGDTAP